MSTQPRFGAGQLFFLIFLSRIVLTLTYSISSGGHTVNNADWLAAIFMPLVLLVIAIPSGLFLSVSNNQDICSFSYTLHPFVGKTVSVLYSALFFILAYTPVARFSFFVTSAMQPEQGNWFFPILIFLPVCFAAVKGVQAIVRTGAVFAVVSMVAIGVIVLALLPRFDRFNIYSPLYDGWGEVGHSLTLMLSNSLELSMILMLAPMVRGSIKKAYLCYAVLAPVVLFGVLFTVVAVLGDYANLQLFPFYSVAGIARIGELTNLSALEASVWIVGVYVKSSMYLYLSHRCLCRIVPDRYRTIALCVLSAAGVVVAALSSETVKKAQLNFSVSGTLVIGCIFLIVIPLVLALAGKVKKKDVA